MNKIGDQGKCSHQIEVDGRVRNNESKLIGEVTTSLNAFYYLHNSERNNVTFSLCEDYRFRLCRQC